MVCEGSDVTGCLVTPHCHFSPLPLFRPALHYSASLLPLAGLAGLPVGSWTDYNITSLRATSNTCSLTTRGSAVPAGRRLSWWSWGSWRDSAVLEVRSQKSNYTEQHSSYLQQLHCLKSKRNSWMAGFQVKTIIGWNWTGKLSHFQLEIIQLEGDRRDETFFILLGVSRLVQPHVYLISADLEPHSVPGTISHITLEAHKVSSAVESHNNLYFDRVLFDWRLGQDSFRSVSQVKQQSCIFLSRNCSQRSDTARLTEAEKPYQLDIN